MAHVFIEVALDPLVLVLLAYPLGSYIAKAITMESIAIFAGLEYPTGALRTILNVDGDVYAALLVSASEGNLRRDIFNDEATYEAPSE